MKTTYSIAAAQAKFPRIVRDSENALIKIKKRDGKVTYVISKERMESLLETFEIMCNPKTMKALKADREGKTKYYPLESLDED